MAKFNIENYTSFFAAFEAKASWALPAHHYEEADFGLLDSEESLDFFAVGVSDADSYIESGSSVEAVDELTPQEEAEWAAYRARCAVWADEARVAHAARVEDQQARAHWEAVWGKKARR